MSEDNSNNPAQKDASVGKGTSSLSDLFINRPVMTVLLSLAAAFFGIFCYRQMPIIIPVEFHMFFCRIEFISHVYTLN